ncbi:MAG: HAD-IA family hydrolase [Lachnospiraceae bacterium]|jgi:phosphoglycolate phosphatase-like HAD superfamily hydrolase|nr:HAD-IA family hydrolase [Lachnospiraceae bacterium]
MEKYESYIWDFDGTLFESYKRMSLAFCKAVQEYGAEQGKEISVSQQEIRQKMKCSVGVAWRYYQARYQLPESVIERYRDLEKNMPEEPFAPFPETKTVLSQLFHGGSRHFVYTHRGNETGCYLEKFGLANYFTGLITAADGFPAKPAPDALMYLIDRYQIKPEQALMIGDRIIDMQAAQNAGIAGCLFDPENEIENGIGGYRIQSLSQLITDGIG